MKPLALLGSFALLLGAALLQAATMATEAAEAPTDYYHRGNNPKSFHVKHAPLLTVDGNSVAVEVKHGISEEHWIGPIWATDGEGKEFFRQEDHANTAKFEVPEGVQ